MKEEEKKRMADGLRKMADRTERGELESLLLCAGVKGDKTAFMACGSAKRIGEAVAQGLAGEDFNLILSFMAAMILLADQYGMANLVRSSLAEMEKKKCEETAHGDD